MKKIAFFTTIAICLFVIVSLIQSIITLWQKQDLIKTAQLELTREEEENLGLKKQLQIATGEGFLEQEARNKLFMVKEGEKKVIIPESMLRKEAEQEAKDQLQKPNWQQWIDLFFDQKK